MGYAGAVALYRNHDRRIIAVILHNGSRVAGLRAHADLLDTGDLMLLAGVSEYAETVQDRAVGADSDVAAVLGLVAAYARRPGTHTASRPFLICARDAGGMLMGLIGGEHADIEVDIIRGLDYSPRSGCDGLFLRDGVLYLRHRCGGGLPDWRG